MLSLADLYDEIEAMKTGSDDCAVAKLSFLQQRIQTKVELLDGELVVQEDWDPSLQRAVKIEPALPGQTGIKVIQSISSGLKLNGRILRKQAVQVSKPQ